MVKRFFAEFAWASSGLFFAAFFVTGPARASELFSESVYVPPLNILDPVAFPGADLSQVWKHFHILTFGSPNLPAQDATDTNTDPFAVNGTSTITTSNSYFFPAAATGLWVGPGPIKLPGLSSVTFNGSVAINAGNIPNQGQSNPPGQVQFGLVGPLNNSPMNFIGQHWGYEPGSPVFLRSVPIVSVIPSVVAPATPPVGQSFDYIANFIQFTEDGISGTEWAEFPYLPGQQPTFKYGGWADPADAIHFTANEIQLSPTQIPLDDLNFANDPLAGGGAGPAFSTQNLPADIVPEPGIGGIIAIFAVGALARRVQRQITAVG